MSRYFRSNDEDARKRLLMLLAMVAETELHEAPCPLFYSQLNELEVLFERAGREIRKLNDNKQD